MTTFMNLASSTLPNLGSGRISRLGTSRRRGIFDFLVTVQLSRLSAATAPISRGPLTCLGDMPGLHDSGRRAAGYCEFGYCGDYCLGRLAPYLERACLRSLTPWRSREPRTM